jgi:hypothetical protein
MVRKQADDTLLVLANNQQKENLKELTKIGNNIEINVTEFQASSKFPTLPTGIIKGRDLSPFPDETIISEMAKQNVVEITRYKHQDMDLGIYRLTFSKQPIPKEVFLYGCRIKCEPYYPSPFRCFKCLRFGHTAIACTKPKTCKFCFYFL